MVAAVSPGLSNNLCLTSFLEEGSPIKPLLDAKKFSEALTLADCIADSGQRGLAIQEIFDAAIKDSALGGVADARLAAIRLPGMKAKGLAFQKVIDRYLEQSNHAEAQETFQMMCRYSSGANVSKLLEENRIEDALNACSEVPSKTTAIEIASNIEKLTVSLEGFEKIKEATSEKLTSFPSLQKIILDALVALCKKLGFDSSYEEDLNKRISQLPQEPASRIYFEPSKFSSSILTPFIVAPSVEMTGCGETAGTFFPSMIERFGQELKSFGSELRRFNWIENGFKPIGNGFIQEREFYIIPKGPKLTAFQSIIKCYQNIFKQVQLLVQSLEPKTR